ncbi:Coiled-coil domain-containing protein 38 [Borealophlyctis nickersoniae]|nr:Coiled-coil domain-containing protein 38 [Borealophlyctis nickersoniae]
MASAVATPLTHPKDTRRLKPHRINPKYTSSPRSKILKLPDISSVAVSRPDTEAEDTHDEGDVGAEVGGGGEKRKKNPFHMPSDAEVFAMREEERRVKQEAKEKMKHLSIYEKNVVKRKNFKSLLSEDADDVEFYEQLRKRDSDKILVNRHTRADRHFKKENLHDFIAKKREMFLVQYALGVKREEMRKLEEIAQAEEQKLLDDEKALEEDAAKFDAFLKENDKNSVEAIKRAEMETKAKLEKIQEIKKLNVQIMSIRSDMSKNEDQLKDLQRYRQFLDKLTPREFFEEQAKAKKKPEDKAKESTEEIAGGAAAKGAKYSSHPRRKTGRAGKPGFKSTKPDADEEAGGEDGTEGGEEEGGGVGGGGEDKDDPYMDDDEPLLFFKTPQQLLDIFAELEENNLALIQNCQETEETLEELKQRILETDARMEKETQSLKQQIEFLNEAIAREEEKARMLEERAKLFSSGVVGAESQEKLLDELNHKVKEVYRRCIGDNEANLSTLTMLTNIENKLEQLFETIEMMPPDRVEQAEKMKDKERRQRLREEKMDAQRALQEERVQRALERARAPVKKKTGKPVVFRSAPPQKKKKKEEDTKKKEEGVEVLEDKYTHDLKDSLQFNTVTAIMKHASAGTANMKRKCPVQV